MRLTHDIRPVQQLDPTFRLEMHALMAACYEDVSLDAFERDLARKTVAVLLLDERGALMGFSTQEIYQTRQLGQEMKILFSGDTIVSPECWGSQELVKGWCKVAAGMLAGAGDLPCYWFLISKGYRTYLYLPLFFEIYHPCRTGSDDLHKLLDALAEEKFPGCYDEATGLIRFLERGARLGNALADIPPHRGHDPNVDFFLLCNPDYRDGVELACLAPITLENTRGVGRRLLTRALA
jgi:hypothetical protein